MIDISIKNTEVYSGTGLVSGGTQGGLYYNDRIYQFGNGGYCQVLDMDLNKLTSFRLPPYADNTGTYPHCSSVEWIVPGQKVAVTTNATGLVDYADRIYIYDISDTSNITQEILMLDVTDINKYARMACMAYDQTAKIMYIAGYTSGASKSATSPCWFESFDLSGYIDNGTLTAAPRLSQTETSGPGLHLQDGGFYNGYIYYLCDRDDTTNSSYNGLYIWILNKDFGNVAVVDIFPGNPYEAETFCIIPGEGCITLLSSIYKNGITYYKTRVGLPEPDPALTLRTSVNVLAYNVNGAVYTDDVTLDSGTYTITPVLKDGAVWSKWSDGETSQARTVVASSDDPVEYTAYAIQEIVYLVGAPAPISASGYGTSVNVNGTPGVMNFIVSSNGTYPNEYMMFSDGKQNDADEDIKVLGAASFGTREITYFDEHNITNGVYYFTSIPDGYTKINIKLATGTGEDNTPNTRNPNVFFISGDDTSSLAKAIGNTDIYRPVDTSIIGDEGLTFDLSAIKIKNGTIVSVTPKARMFVLMRLVGSSARNNNSSAVITFIKDATDE